MRERAARRRIVVREKRHGQVSAQRQILFARLVQRLLVQKLLQLQHCALMPLAELLERLQTLVQFAHASLHGAHFVSQWLVAVQWRCVRKRRRRRRQWRRMLVLWRCRRRKNRLLVATCIHRAQMMQRMI